ncbi:MAG: secretin and TonB N-terminal domain-containing protein [Calditrichae bacterium]|nr:secretin and TonB N-terminal domain-containing protein [Calditrichia bacterium]
MRRRILVITLCFFTSIFASNLQDKLKQKVSPKFDGASITDVLKLFALQHSLNMVVSDDVKGRVSIQLYDVTLEDALNTILKSMGYHYVIDNEVLMVKPFETEMNGELVSRVFYLNYTNAFFLVNALSPMLSSKGKMMPLLEEPEKDEIKQRASVLVVTDLWENVRQIANVIKELDVVAKQLLIEVRLVESLIGEEEQYGLNLPKRISASMDGAETTAPITKSQSSSGDQRLLSAWYQIPNNSNDLNMGVLNVDQLTIALDMLAKDNGSRLVSNPKVTTLNNKKAIVKIGTTVPVPEVSRGIAGDLITYREKEVNIDLEVIPQVGDNDKITMQVHPIMEEIIGYTGTADAPQPITSKREVNATVTVINGQTLVLGGLIKETKTKTVEKLWLLGDIPILGYLFQNAVTRNEKSDLLIFITPKIIEYQGTARD